jgi:hypothetical protein
LGHVSRGAEKVTAVKLFNRLIEKAPKEPSARLAELAEAKLRLAGERAAIEKQLSQRDDRREKMLVEDRSAKEILGLDVECDELHVALEKVAAKERFLDHEAARASEAETLSEWIAVNDRRLESARRYAESLHATQQAYLDFSQVRQEALSPQYRALYCGFGFVPIPPSPPQLEMFKQQIEVLEDYERARKETISRSNEAA